MLGHGKITFETPNVIDPGEIPPARPSRLERQKYSDTPDLVVRERPNYTDRDDHRERFKASLTRTIKLQVTKDDEIDSQSDEASLDSEDLEYGTTVMGDRRRSTSSANTPGSPSMDDARLFAATMLAETERRKSQRFDDESSVRSSSSMQWPRRGRRHEFPGLRGQPQIGLEDLEETISRHSREGLLKRRSRRRVVCLRIFIALVILAIIVTFSILAFQARRKPNPTAFDSARLDSVIDVLIQSEMSTRLILGNRLSPQYKAAYWIAIEDAEQLRIPVQWDRLSYRFLQRYVLAVLYFSWNGPKWSNQLNFVSDLHECSWFESIPDESGELFAIGVTCDEHLQVRNLMICELVAIIAACMRSYFLFLVLMIFAFFLQQRTTWKGRFLKKSAT